MWYAILKHCQSATHSFPLLSFLFVRSPEAKKSSKEDGGDNDSDKSGYKERCVLGCLTNLKVVTGSPSSIGKKY